jgi:hypothetical protein
MAQTHLSSTGMAFVKPKTMIKRFSYKEFTLLFGILVALLIIFALWFGQPSAMFSRSSKLLEWKVNVPKVNVKELVKVFEELP